MSSRISLGRAASSDRTAGAWVNGAVASTISCSASVMRPSPIRMRPTRPALPFWREMKVTTPMKISSGETHDRSNE